MIEHAVSEGLSLLRSRIPLSIGLAASLAIPLTVGGIIASTAAWLRPMVASAPRSVVVPVLLHPQMDDAQRSSWLADVRRSHPGWLVREVPEEELGERMVSWFPYLQTLLRQDGAPLLPPLLEVETDDPKSVDTLLDSPRVIAIGPRSSLLQQLGRNAARLAVWLGGCAFALLASAGLLAAVWVHLELFRHADEITIMRLVGATEGTVQGPFLVAVAVPGLLAGTLATAGMYGVCRALSRLAEGVGLPPILVPWWVAVLCVLGGVGLPLSTAIWTLGRHAHLELDV